jgi:hypothetical protein
MDRAKKGFLPVIKGKPLSVTQGQATAKNMEKDIEMVSNIPYASENSNNN